MAGGAMVTGGAGAVVDVLAAVVARPAVDADAVVAAVRVVARAAVLTGVRHQLTLVHVLGTVLTWGGGGGGGGGGEREKERGRQRQRVG